MACIIIPAHNEASVIERSLQSLIEQARSEDQIIVSCNGCTDDTVQIARRFEPRVTVLDSPIPSKTCALNFGEQSATTFPRIYMDADIILGEGALQKIEQALSPGGLLAVSPEPSMDLDEASWGVRAYYDIWLSMPYCQKGMLGAGVYALSEEGRKRFDSFPQLIADDGYVRALFKEYERGKVKGAKATVKAPASLHWLIKIKTRSRLGAMELAIKHPELIANEEKDYSSAFLGVLSHPEKWLKFSIYLYVNLVSRFLAKRRMAQIGQYKWEKDFSSR